MTYANLAVMETCIYGCACTFVTVPADVDTCVCPCLKGLTKHILSEQPVA